MTPFETAALVVLIASVAGVAYAYIVFPLGMYAISRLWPRYGTAPEIDESDLPSVTLLIAAYNEEEVIRERLENATALDYPPELLETVIASDGSDDATAEIVREFADRNVRLLDSTERRGKSAVLTAAVPECKGDIIVFSDANTDFQPDAIRKLVRWFTKPEIDVVSGRLIITDPETGTNVDGMYWRYELMLRGAEGRMGLGLGANGAIYAMRKQHFVAPPPNTMIDDFVIPMLLRLDRPTIHIVDPTALAHEEAPPFIENEFKRRARIGTGAFQALSVLWPLLSPRQGWLAFVFGSHKLVRWFVPFMLIGALVSNAALLAHPLFQVTMAFQVAALVGSWLGTLTESSLLPFKLLRAGAMFTAMNAALVVGLWRYLTTHQVGTWQRTAR